MGLMSGSLSELDQGEFVGSGFVLLEVFCVMILLFFT